jgi:hypothetical protein
MVIDELLLYVIRARRDLLIGNISNSHYIVFPCTVFSHLCRCSFPLVDGGC